MYSILVKNEDSILFAEDWLRQLNYTFPGPQMKSWFTTFDTDLKTESAFSLEEQSPICSIVKRRDVRENADVYLPQMTNDTFHMSACLCPLDKDGTATGVNRKRCRKILDFAQLKRDTNCHFVKVSFPVR